MTNGSEKIFKDGVCHYKAKKYDESISTFSILLGSGGSKPNYKLDCVRNALFHRAKAYTKIQKGERAIMDLTLLIALQSVTHPTKLQAHHLRATIYMRRRQFAEAANDFLVVARSAESKCDIYFWLCYCLSEIVPANLDELEQSASAGLVTPCTNHNTAEHELAQAGLAAIKARAQHDSVSEESKDSVLEAFDMLTRALRKYPDLECKCAQYSDIYARLIEIIVDRQKRVEAELVGEFLLSRNKRRKFYCLFRAHMFFSCGKFDVLINDATECLKELPNDCHSLRMRALCYLEKKEYKNALGDCDVICDSQPDSSEAFWIRGLCYLRLGNGEESERDLTNALVLQPGHIEATLYRAQSRVILGKLTDALQDFYYVIQNEFSPPQNLADAYIGRGQIFQKGKHMKDAISDYRNAMKYTPLTQEGKIFLLKRKILEARKKIGDKHTESNNDSKANSRHTFSSLHSLSQTAISSPSKSTGLKKHKKSKRAKRSWDGSYSQPTRSKQDVVSVVLAGKSLMMMNSSRPSLASLAALRPKKKMRHNKSNHVNTTVGNIGSSTGQSLEDSQSSALPSHLLPGMANNNADVRSNGKYVNEGASKDHLRSRKAKRAQRMSFPGGLGLSSSNLPRRRTEFPISPSAKKLPINRNTRLNHFESMPKVQMGNTQSAFSSPTQPRWISRGIDLSKISQRNLHKTLNSSLPPTTNSSSGIKASASSCGGPSSSSLSACISVSVKVSNTPLGLSDICLPPFTTQSAAASTLATMPGSSKGALSPMRDSGSPMPYSQSFSLAPRLVAQDATVGNSKLHPSCYTTPPRPAKKSKRLQSPDSPTLPAIKSLRSLTRSRTPIKCPLTSATQQYAPLSPARRTTRRTAHTQASVPTTHRMLNPTVPLPTPPPPNTLPTSTGIQTNVAKQTGTAMQTDVSMFVSPPLPLPKPTSATAKTNQQNCFRWDPKNFNRQNPRKCSMKTKSSRCFFSRGTTQTTAEFLSFKTPSLQAIPVETHSSHTSGTTEGSIPAPMPPLVKTLQLAQAIQQSSAQRDLNTSLPTPQFLPANRTPLQATGCSGKVPTLKLLLDGNAAINHQANTLPITITNAHSPTLPNGSVGPHANGTFGTQMSGVLTSPVSPLSSTTEFPNGRLNGNLSGSVNRGFGNTLAGMTNGVGRFPSVPINELSMSSAAIASGGVNGLASSPIHSTVQLDLKRKVVRPMATSSNASLRTLEPTLGKSSTSMNECNISDWIKMMTLINEAEDTNIITSTAATDLLNLVKARDKNISECYLAGASHFIRTAVRLCIKQ